MLTDDKDRRRIVFSHSSIVRPGMHSSQQQKKCYGHCRFNIQPRFRLPSTTYKVCRHSLSCWILCTVSFSVWFFWGGGEWERTSAACSVLLTTKIKNGKKAPSTSDRSVTPHCTKHDTLQKVVYHIRFTQLNRTLKLFTYYHIQVHRVLTSVYCDVHL